MKKTILLSRKRIIRIYQIDIDSFMKELMKFADKEKENLLYQKRKFTNNSFSITKISIPLFGRSILYTIKGDIELCADQNTINLKISSPFIKEVYGMINLLILVFFFKIISDFDFQEIMLPIGIAFFLSNIFVYIFSKLISYRGMQDFLFSLDKSENANYHVPN